MRKLLVFTFSLSLIFFLTTCSKQSEYEIKSARLLSKFSQDVNPEKPLPEYPRPQLVRKEWKNLNGLWDYAITPKNKQKNKEFDGKILVPYPVESALSGVKKRVTPEQKLWYHKSFTIPQKWRDKRILLHFGAVDWQARILVNGNEVGVHKGGYDAFTFDISNYLEPGRNQKLEVSVYDPTNKGHQPRGKQVLDPHGIWYTAVTGIWQTVWLEPVEKSRGYIKSIDVQTDIDEGFVEVNPQLSMSDKNHKLIIIVKDKEEEVAKYKGPLSESYKIKIENPHLWSPGDPFLYDLNIRLLYNDNIIDEVDSYFGMRKISLGKDQDGITRMKLNNEVLFQFGLLDQGWWPDGLYRAPTDEALRYDIEVTKKMGYNMARKHVKVEPARWYYWCDKLGLLVWQDMPNGDEPIDPNQPDLERSKKSAQQYETELLEMLAQFGNHPSIICWVPFNEGWGQSDTERITNLINNTDPTRLVNSASGWADRNVGDMHDIHAYPGPEMPEPEEKRAIVLGEFGGLGLPIEGHTWQSSDNWGYRNYQNREELKAAYIDLIRQLQGMISKGLSAAIYTQTTDVEVEVNGLMTYDRGMIKIEPQYMQRINKGYLPPVFSSGGEIFLNSTKVELSNELQKGKIYYTLDDSEPTQDDRLYEKPIKLKSTKTVRARTYWSDGKFSSETQKTFSKVEPLQSIKAEVVSGVEYYYYEQGLDDFSKLPDFEDLSPKSKGITNQFNLAKAEKDYYFAMQFKGLIEVPRRGIYTFYSNSDDGTKLFIHDQLIVDNDFTHSMTEKTGQIALEQGKHPIELLFFQGEGGKGLEVSFAGPCLGKNEIPAENLFHKRN